MANDNQQEMMEEGWQAHDLRSGVAKVYAEAKERSTLGIRVVAVWSVLIFIFGTIDMAGIANVAPAFWDIAAGFAGILLAALAVSRTPGPMLGSAALVVGDLVMLAYHLPEMLDHGSASDHILTYLRMALAPVALFLILNGYFGALSIQAFKQGFSPGADWRTRINPRMMQFVVACSCVGAVVVGVAVWMGAIATGFAQTDVVWLTKILFKKPIHMDIAKPDVKEAKNDGGQAGVFADFNILDSEHRRNAGPKVYPETAKPIVNFDGLDAYAKSQVQEAFEFAQDSDESGCLLEGHGRQDRCRDDRCKYWARVFARACMAKSKKTEHFCDAVPDAMAQLAGETWAQRMCAGRNYDTCREMLYTVQGHCHPPTAAELKGDFSAVNAAEQAAAATSPAAVPPSAPGKPAREKGAKAEAHEAPAVLPAQGGAASGAANDAPAAADPPKPAAP